jgi:hypothetical protein
MDLLRDGVIGRQCRPIIPSYGSELTSRFTSILWCLVARTRATYWHTPRVSTTNAYLCPAVSQKPGKFQE